MRTGDPAIKLFRIILASARTFLELPEHRATTSKRSAVEKSEFNCVICFLINGISGEGNRTLCPHTITESGNFGRPRSANSRFPELVLCSPCQRFSVIHRLAAPIEANLVCRALGCRSLPQSLPKAVTHVIPVRVIFDAHLIRSHRRHETNPMALLHVRKRALAAERRKASATDSDGLHA